MRRTLFVLGLLIGSAPSMAAACSCAFTEDWGFYAQDKTHLPANGRGLLWTGRSPVTAADFSITPADGGAPLTVVLTPRSVISGEPVLLVEAKEGLRVGAAYDFAARHYDRYRFRAEGGRIAELPGGRQLVRVTVDAAELQLTGPIDLTLDAVTEARLRVAAGASCSAEITARQARIQAALPEAARPYVEHLLFATRFGEAPAPRFRGSLCQRIPVGRSWRAPGEDLVYRGCGGHGSQGSREAKLSLTMDVHFPAAEQRVRTAAKMVDLGICETTGPLGGQR